jgi:hypothetical protein
MPLSLVTIISPPFHKNRVQENRFLDFVSKQTFSPGSCWQFVIVVQRSNCPLLGRLDATRDTRRTECRPVQHEYHCADLPASRYLYIVLHQGRVSREQCSSAPSSPDRHWHILISHIGDAVEALLYSQDQTSDCKMSANHIQDLCTHIKVGAVPCLHVCEYAEAGQGEYGYP